MNHSLNISKTGLHAFQYHLDTVANDVANVNTLGYKARQAEFQTLLANNYTASDTLLMDEGLNGVAISGGARTDDYTIDQAMGNIVESEGDHQFAIAGDGYFQITAGNGETYYTRDGNFTLDITGSTVVNSRGESVTMVGNKPAVFQANGQEMLPVGENKYVANGAMIQTDTEVLAGFVEQSNVDLATAITDMMVAQRAYAMNVKAAQSTDEMMTMINQFKQ